MKKIVLYFLFSIAIVGCKSKSATNTLLDKKTEVGMKGNWTVSSVTYPGSDYIKVTSFDIADSKCFVGSTWHLISNNNKGDMALNSSKCTTFSSPITWFVNRENQFVLKILNDTKSKKVLDGYVLGVANQTESSFELVDKINVGGKIVDVVYHFNKN